MSKKLFLLVNDCGDGSYSIKYTFNEAWIERQQERYDNNELDCQYDAGVDGDGFNYKILTVPDECTLESLDIYSDCAENTHD